MVKKVVFLVCVLFAYFMIGQTATVNGTSYGTIADAYDAAVGGDTIFIDGIFDEKLTSNKAVSLQGDDPTTDGIVFTGTGRVLFYTNEVLEDFSISNLTISGGNSTANGAGILIDKSKGNQITLNNLIIENNTTTAVGGGVSINSANVDINTCIIKNNTALQGGGLHLGTNNNANDPDLDKIVNVKQSLITENSSTTNGAGFYIYGFGNEMRITANFENTTIALNTATASGGSGRIYGEAYAGDTSTNNVIVNMTHVTSARNSAAQSTESEKNNFGIYFTTGGGGGPVFNAYNSILASAGIIGNRGINFIQSNPGSLINNVMGGQLNINTADVNTNNLTGRTASQIGLAADLTDEGGFSNILELTDGDAVDYCSSDTGTSLPVVDQRNYLRDDFPDAGAFELGGTPLPGASCATALVIIPGVYNDVVISVGNESASKVDAVDALWYLYTAETDGTININSCISDPVGVNTRLWVYTNGCDTLTAIANNDDGCDAPNSFGSIVTEVPVVGGQEYLIEWDDRWGADPFDWELTFTATPGVSCATALVAIPGVYNDVAISIGNGSASQADADDALWYVYTAETDGTININSCISDPVGINTRLWVYTNGCDTLTAVADDDDGCDAPNGFGSRVADVSVVEGQEYLIEWDDRWGADPFDWELTFTAPIVELPITFEDSQTPVFIDFNGSETRIIANPDASGDNTSDIVAQNIVPSNTGSAGVNFAVENLDITILKGFTMTVWSPVADTPVLLKLENTITGVDSERAAITSTTGAWEKIYFDFSEEGDLTFESVTLFMNFNVVDSENQTYYWDNLVQGEALNIKQNDLIDIAMYPNPATSIITLDASEEIESLQITNLLGQNVSIIEVNNTKSTINVSQFRTGIYFTKVFFSSGNIQIIKFIKE